MTFDPGVRVTGNVAHYHLHHVTYAAAKIEAAPIYKQCDGWMHRPTDGQIDGRQTDFGINIMYPFFSKEKAGINFPFQLGMHAHTPAQKLEQSILTWA